MQTTNSKESVRAEVHRSHQVLLVSCCWRLKTCKLWSQGTGYYLVRLLDSRPTRPTDWTEWHALFHCSHAMPYCRTLDKDSFMIFLQRYCLLASTPFTEFGQSMLARLQQPDRTLDTVDEQAAQRLADAQSDQVTSMGLIHCGCTKVTHSMQVLCTRALV